MKSKIKIEYINLTSLDKEINNLPRCKTLVVKFNDSNEYKRENIGNFLKTKYPNFVIGIHSIEKIINIYRIITDEEIESNLDFFTRCAIDYDKLACSLMYALIKKHNLNVNWQLPIITFNQFHRKTKGKMNGWKYILHGGDFRFENIKTNQIIEANTYCGNQFGALDPLFFSEYILSTLEYQPLPVEIYDECWDGTRILKILLKHGILKEIINNQGFSSIVLSTNDTSEIKIYEPEPLK